MVEGTAAERAPAEHPAGGQYSLLAPHSTPVEIHPPPLRARRLMYRLVRIAGPPWTDNPAVARMVESAR